MTKNGFAYYYLPGQLEQSIGEFVLLAPAEDTRLLRQRTAAILKRRETIKRKTIEQRRRLHQQAIAA